jgi:thioredoxin
MKYIVLIIILLVCLITSYSFSPTKIGINIKHNNNNNNCKSTTLIKKFQQTHRQNLHRLYNFKNFDEMLEQLDVPVLVDFYAQWCGPCQMMQPVLEDLASRLDSVARVAKVDTDKSPRLASRYQVEALPTLILFHKGKVIER